MGKEADPTITKEYILAMAHSNEHFDFGSLTELDAVQHPELEALKHELEKLAEGKVDQQQLDALGISAQTCQKKTKLVDLASLGAKHLNEPVTYGDVAKALEITVDQVEFWIIDGRRQN